MSGWIEATLGAAFFAVLIVGVGVFGIVRATQPAHAHDGHTANVPRSVQPLGRH